VVAASTDAAAGEGDPTSGMRGLRHSTTGGSDVSLGRDKVAPGPRLVDMGRPAWAWPERTMMFFI
jgi:hypothetical protein